MNCGNGSKTVSESGRYRQDSKRRTIVGSLHQKCTVDSLNGGRLVALPLREGGKSARERLKEFFGCENTDQNEH